jgi:hypothetical protein
MLDKNLNGFITVFVEMLFRESLGNLSNKDRRRHNGLHVYP